MILKKVFRSIILVFLLAGSLYAGKLTVVSSNISLVPYSWDYRVVSTRKFLPGCMMYDVLQGTGWFPTTWYNDYSPEIVDDNYVFTTKTNFAQWYCGAEMDQYNYLQLEYVNEKGETVYGRFSVVPDGEEEYDEINCYKDENADKYNQIVCENAHVNWFNKSDIIIDVLLD